MQGVVKGKCGDSYIKHSLDDLPEYFQQPDAAIISQVPFWNQDTYGCHHLLGYVTGISNVYDEFYQQPPYVPHPSISLLVIYLYLLLLLYVLQPSPMILSNHLTAASGLTSVALGHCTAQLFVLWLVVAQWQALKIV